MPCMSFLLKACLRRSIFPSLRGNYEVIDEAIQLKNANL
ncbi:hypothetical protein RBEAN4_0662 [Rickettsia bellii str. RML An4]|uniref:Uncharacterized protein n=1 Tax=Rickettsia bellii str. RML An4 TaxID=1359193 RepID=A0A0F3QC01_RICBE|nr:hypothetical protein RBEAN4_0662 [Rickettsia bellii str. RML An4]